MLDARLIKMSMVGTLLVVLVLVAVACAGADPTSIPTSAPSPAPTAILSANPIAPAAGLPTEPAAVGAAVSTVVFEVEMRNFSFTPAKITIKEGENVRWTNQDGVRHTVTSGSPNDRDAGSRFDAPLLSPGENFSQVFAGPGTFPFFCRVHPTTMRGAIVVQPRQEGTTVPRPTPTRVANPTPLVGTPSNDTFEAEIQLIAFVPARITIKVGDAIRWTNQGRRSHTVTSGSPNAPDAGSRFDGPVLPPSTSFRHIFDRPGTFPFFCRVHPTAMRGAIIVQAATTVMPTTTPTPAPTTTPIPAPTTAPSPKPTSAPYPPPTSAPVSYQLLVSASPDRSNPVPLDGQLVSGAIYVFISPDAGVFQVTFFLNGNRIKTEQSAPYDFRGTTTDGNAAAFDTSEVQNGEYVMAAVVDRTAGASPEVKAGFTVNN